MCNKAVGTYAHALQFIPSCNKTPKMCNNAAAMQLVPDWCKTQPMCGKFVSKDCVKILR